MSYKTILVLSILLLCSVFVLGQGDDSNLVTVPSFDILVSDTISTSGDKPYGMLIDVPEDVELATIVINGIALDLTGGTVILWRDDIIADTATLDASADDDFTTRRRPASWSLSVTKGLVKMRIIDPELVEQMGAQSIVVTGGAGVSFNGEESNDGEPLFDIKPFDEDEVENLKAITAAIDAEGELTILTEEQVAVVEDSQGLLNSIEDLAVAEIASEIILDNAFEELGEEAFFDTDSDEFDDSGFEDDANLIEFLINDANLSPAELGELAQFDDGVGDILMNSMLYGEDSLEALADLSAENPEMFDFFVDIVEYDDRAVDYFMGVSANNEFFVDEWDLYIEDDPEFADLFISRLDDPAANVALSGLAGESIYINELMLDIAIYDPEAGNDLLYGVWEDDPANAQIFFDTLLLDDDALLDAQFVFAGNADFFDPLVDEWASDPTLGFAEFYSEVGEDALFMDYDINFSFGASITQCISNGDGTTFVEISFINALASATEVNFIGNGFFTTLYSDIVSTNVSDVDLPLTFVEAVDSTFNIIDGALIGGELCGGDDLAFDDGFYDDLYFEDDLFAFEDDSFAFVAEIIDCIAIDATQTSITFSMSNIPQEAIGFVMYSQFSGVTAFPDALVTQTIDTSELPYMTVEAYDSVQTLDTAFVSGLLCDGFSDPFLEETTEFVAEIVECVAIDVTQTSVTFSMSNIPQGAEGLVLYSQFSGVTAFPDLTVTQTIDTSDLPYTTVEAYDSTQTLATAFVGGLLCDGFGDPIATEDPALSEISDFSAEIIDCSPLDAFSTSVTLFLSDVPVNSTDLVVYTQTNLVSVFPDTTTFLTIDNFELPITTIEAGDGVTAFASTFPIGLTCDGSSGAVTETPTNQAPFAVDIVGCDVASATQTTVTFNVYNAPAETIGLLFYSQTFGEAANPDAVVTKVIDNTELPYTSVEAYSDTQTLDTVVPSGTCVASVATATPTIPTSTPTPTATPMVPTSTPIPTATATTAPFTVEITQCDQGSTQTTVTLALSNISAEATFILAYQSNPVSGISIGVVSSKTIVLDNDRLPFTAIEAERSTSPLLIESVVPTGLTCNPPVATATPSASTICLDSADPSRGDILFTLTGGIGSGQKLASTDGSCSGGLQFTLDMVQSSSENVSAACGALGFSNNTDLSTEGYPSGYYHCW